MLEEDACRQQLQMLAKFYFSKNRFNRGDFVRWNRELFPDKDPRELFLVLEVDDSRVTAAKWGVDGFTLGEMAHWLFVSDGGRRVGDA